MNKIVIVNSYFQDYNCNVCNKTGIFYTLYLLNKEIYLPVDKRCSSSIIYTCSNECIEYVKLLAC